MGRRAKYLTVAERKQEQQRQRLKQAQTLHGKKKRSSQNRRAYLQRQAKSTVEDTKLVLPPISPEIKELASLPLPSSHVFVESVLGSDWFEAEYADSCLQRWDAYPPYGEALRSLINIDPGRLLVILHGKRLREQYEYELARLELYRSQTHHQFVKTVYSDLLVWLKNWEELSAALSQPTLISNDRKMGRNLLQWQARRIIALQEDFESLTSANDRFKSVYVERWVRLYPH